MNWFWLWIFVICFFIEISLKRAYAQKPVCGHPGAPANGNFSPNGATFTADTVVKYKCENGFITAGNEQRTCLRNGTWSGVIPVCTDKNIAVGKVATQSSIYRQQRAQLAVDGLEMTCASTPRTPAERWWQLNLGKSINVALVSISMATGMIQDFSVYIVNTQGGDSQIVYSRCGNFSGMLRSKSIEIYCKNGTGLVGEYVFIRDNRQGSFSMILCEVAVYAVRENRSCGQPERPINSIVKPINQTTVRYSCQEGFSLKGPQLLSCFAGLWENPPPYCSETFCPAPPSVPFSKWSATYAEWFPPQDKTYFPFGTVLTYTCDPNYYINRNGSIICMANGSWSGEQPKCLPTSCDPPPVILNATLHFPNNTSPTQIGVKAEVRCDLGFKLSTIEKSAEIQCFINGSWTENPVSCLIISDKDGVQPALGAVLGVITFLIIVAAIVLVLFYLRQKGYFKGGTLMWPIHNLHNSSRSSDHQLTEAQDESPSKPVGFGESFNNDQDMLYDDVWPSEEAINSGGTLTLVPDSLYADATSSIENLDRVVVANSNLDITEFNDVCAEDGQRIYDQPNDLDDGTETENVYYSPTEPCEQEATPDSIERSELPPADGAADIGDNVHHENAETGYDDDHIYEPLRRPSSPTVNMLRTRPVYAKVDIMNKKFRRSLEDDELATNTVELRQPPEGVTYTTPVFANSDNVRDSASTIGNQRPLPPIPNPPGSRCSVMVDNALYVKGV
ncbi:hypothetical protein CHUAL_006650 [Chamberlinius hualienensis]